MDATEMTEKRSRPGAARRWIKRVALGVVGLLAVAALLAGVRFYLLAPASRPAPDAKAKASPEAIARGKYLTDHNLGCLTCHSAIDEALPGEVIVAGTEGGGRDFGEMPGFPGRVRAPNITPDPDHGIGRWTDGEIMRAIREGVSKNGRPLFPLMPFRRYASVLSDDDTLAVVAYLRTLRPLGSDPGPMELTFPVSMFARLAPQPLASSPGPEPEEPLARGRWLLEAGSCSECHTPAERGKPIPGKSFAGGFKFASPRGVLYSSNITSDPATGIGSYTDQDLMRVFDEGKGNDGRTLYVMPWSVLKGATDQDKHALIAALRAIPPVSNVVSASTFRR